MQFMRIKLSLKRKAADLAGRALNVRVARRGKADQLVEEEHLERFFRHFDVDCVFDVGANDGQYALKLREKLRYRGPIISFEPIPDVVKRLKATARRDRHWHIEEVALDSEARPMTFNVMQGSQFSSLHQPSHDEIGIFAGLNSVAQEIVVTTATLDVYFAKYRDRLAFKRPFLKLDTQGHDVAVTRGAGACLAEFVGLQSELAFKKIYAGATWYREALDFYASAGFELSSLIPNNAGHFPNLVEMDCIMFNRSSLYPTSENRMARAPTE
jgi:FkbM family methyltransferase